jgi:serine kinase of HPr protein (carbohydrate metabolism regulator)
MPAVQIFAFLNGLLDHEISFVVISEHGRPPQAWRDFSESHGIVLCVSRQDAYLLESRLTGLIRENSDGVKIIHANLVAVNNQGVLLTGEAGSGKTRCGIALMQRGHQWIADDTVVLEKKSPTRIIGRAHEATQGLVHLRGRGIMHVEDCLKDISVRRSATINLIVELDLFRNGPWTDEPEWSVQEIMGVPISHVKMLHRGQAGKTAAKLLEHAAYCLQGRVE